MGKRIEMDLVEKEFLVKEYISGRIGGREAARRAGVGTTTMQSWISRYRAERVEGLRQDGNQDKRKYDKRRKVVEEYLSGKGSSSTIAENWSEPGWENTRKWVWQDWRTGGGSVWHSKHLGRWRKNYESGMLD